jgi:hypothetical protein
MAPANQPPTVANPIPTQIARLNVPFTFVVPSNTFSDPNAGQTLTLAASPLPPGLTFNPATSTFSGTPTSLGTNIVTVVATDNGQPPMSATNAFQLVVNPTVSPINVTLKLSGTNYVKLSFATDSGNYYQARTAHQSDGALL